VLFGTLTPSSAEFGIEVVELAVIRLAALGVYNPEDDSANLSVCGSEFISLVIFNLGLEQTSEFGLDSFFGVFWPLLSFAEDCS